MKMVAYCLMLATQVVAMVAFARAAQGRRVAILEAEGASPLTPTSSWIRAFGSAVAATLMMIGLATQRWIGWDIGVMVMVLFFFLEVRRFKKWKGFGKIMTIWILCPLVMLFSLIDLLSHL